jgi:uncharacterized protein YpmB
MYENLLTSVVIFLVIFVVATVSAWKAYSGSRKPEGDPRDRL